MIDIFQYNILFGFFSFLLSFFAIYLILREKVIGIYDPLTYHFLWIASHLGLIFMLIMQDGFELFSLFFLFLLLFYLMMIKLFYPKVNSRMVRIENEITSPFFVDGKIVFFIFYLFVVIIWIYSQSRFINYAIENSFSNLFMYKYLDLQGRDPFLRILGLGISPTFIFLLLYSLFFIRAFKPFSIFFLTVYIFTSIISGGRSTLVSLVFLLGTFVYFYIPYFSIEFKKRMSYISLFLLFLGILIFTYVTSVLANKDIEQAIGLVLNRMLANGDGLYYYIKYSGESNLDSGFLAYILSFLGIYIKSFLDFDYKNIGHQLSELAVGGQLDFAQGANYTIFLQAVILGIQFSVVYIALMCFLASRLRRLEPSKSLSKTVLFYGLLSISLSFITDLEFGFLRLISFVIIFLFLLVPFLFFVKLFKHNFIVRVLR